jgi:HEAT repeat protein
MALFGPPNIEKLKAKGDIKGLIKALSYKQEVAVRQAAARSLVELGYALNAVSGLRETRDTWAVEPLTVFLKDNDWRVRQAAAEQLDRLGWQPDRSDLGATYWVTKGAWDRCVELGNSALGALVFAVEHGDGEMRRAATEALGCLGDPRAIDPLITALEDDHRLVRQAAAESLGKITTQLEDAALGAQVVEPLIVALEDKDEDVRRAAATALGQIGAQLEDAEQGAQPEEFDSLVDLFSMQMQEAEIPFIDACFQASEWMFGSPDAQPEASTLQEQAEESPTSVPEDADDDMREDTEPSVRMGDVRAVEALIAALKDENQDVREAAAGALAKFGASAVGPLIANLKNEDEEMRWEVSKVLDNLDWQPDKGEAGVAYWIARREWDKCVEIGGLAVELLIAVLKDESEEVRQAAARALGQIGAQTEDPALCGRAARFLRDALEDDASGTRQAAAEALGWLGDSQATEPLIAALQDVELRVCQAAAEALGRIAVELGDAPLRSRVEKSLSAALMGEDEGIRVAAAKALDNLGWEPDQDEAGAIYWVWKGELDQCVRIGKPAVAPLAVALKAGDEGMRRAAAEALGRTAAQLEDIPLRSQVEESLIAALENKDEDEGVRLTAAQALDNLGWEPGQDEIGAIYWIWKGELDRCVRIGMPAVMPLAAALKSEDQGMRAAAAGALGKIGARLDDTTLRTRVMTSLIAALRDSDEDVRQAAANGLGHIGWPAVEPVVALLRRKNDALRQAAIEALVQIGVPAIDPLIANLEDSDKSVRRAAAMALVALYQEGKLSKQERHLIRAQRDQMVRPHTDQMRSQHTDYWDVDIAEGSDCAPRVHSDKTWSGHADTGIGVSF